MQTGVANVIGAQLIISCLCRSKKKTEIVKNKANWCTFVNTTMKYLDMLNNGMSEPAESDLFSLLE